VQSDGIGQRNTKGTLLMALLRAVGVACRTGQCYLRMHLMDALTNFVQQRWAICGATRVSTSETTMPQRSGAFALSLNYICSAQPNRSIRFAFMQS
jgi:hypothetical protein